MRQRLDFKMVMMMLMLLQGRAGFDDYGSDVYGSDDYDSDGSY